MANYTLQGLGPTYVKKNKPHSSDNDLIKFNTSWRSIVHRKKKRCRSLLMKINAVVNDSTFDFEDSDWKIHYQDQFEERMRLPHLNDNLNVTPRQTTFFLKNRYISLEMFSNVFYIHDFTLLTFLFIYNLLK